jgi:hypothetical protein
VPKKNILGRARPTEPKYAKNRGEKGVPNIERQKSSKMHVEKGAPGIEV